MALSQRITELTSVLVAAPSHETEADVQQLIADRLSACGFECTLEDVAPGRPNLVARRGDGGLFVCSHADTHPPHAHPDPFMCRRQGDLLVGRGVLDVKGQIAALITALEDEKAAPALVAITCDEEALGQGSANISIPDGPWFADGGIVLEPTDMRICTVQTGHIDVAVGVSGTPGHVYGEGAGASPITAVLAAADALNACSFLAVRHPLLPDARVQINRIEGGEHLWRRPARAHVEIAIGIVPGVDVHAAEAEVRARLDDVAASWGSRGTSFLYDILDTSEPITVSEELPVVSKLSSALGAPFEPAGMPSWTDAGFLLTKHALPCVIFGAGELGPAHSDHEWVRLPDLERLASVLRNLLSAQ